MGMTDPIADLLTRMRNAMMKKHPNVRIPSSKFKLNLLKLFEQEGFIKEYHVVKTTGYDEIEISLKYDTKGNPVVNEIKRVSKPGCRIYLKHDKIPMIQSGLGVAMLSTSRGMVTDRTARKEHLGGELVCTVW